MAGVERAAKALYTLFEKQRPKHLSSIVTTPSKEETKEERVKKEVTNGKIR